MRVLTYKHVNDGIKKLALDVAEKINKQRMLGQKRRTAEENKTIFEIRVNKWKIDLVYHKEVIIPEWEAKCAEVDLAWTTAKQNGHRGKKPPYPTRPKKPLKPKKKECILEDLSTSVRLVGVPEEEEDVQEGEDDIANVEDEDEASEGGVDEQDLIDSMGALEIGHFAEVSAYIYYSHFPILQADASILTICGYRH